MKTTDKLQITIDSRVDTVFKNYPAPIKEKIEQLRQLIIETATETESISAIEETLKWGEPSYLTKKGSTIRINARKNDPEAYVMYFQCTSSLVSTFKIVFKDTFLFEGKRAIVFNLNDDIPTNELKQCIKAALTYHSIKHLPLLGL